MNVFAFHTQLDNKSWSVFRFVFQVKFPGGFATSDKYAQSLKSLDSSSESLLVNFKFANHFYKYLSVSAYVCYKFGPYEIRSINCSYFHSLFKIISRICLEKRTRD